MKKWIVLAALALSVGLAAEAGAAGSRLKTVGLSWDTWTPQGPVAGADTTFITGGTQTQDTTGVFDATKVDWAPTGRLDPNLANVIAAFKAFVYSGTSANISVDSVTVTIEGSMDKVNWYPAKAATAVGAPTTHVGNSQIVSFPYVPFWGLGDNNSSGAFPIAWPYFRFIVKADGSTTARHVATKFKVSYYVADDKIATAPRIEWKQLRWGTWAAGAFVPSADTSSIAGTGATVDTTGTADWGRYMLGPGIGHGIVALSDSSASVAQLFVQYTDQSENDSVFVAQQGSPDNYVFSSNSTLVALTPNAGFYTGVPVGVSQALNGVISSSVALGLGVVPAGSTFGQFYPESQFATPFTRFVIRGSTGGEVLGAVKVWIGRWVAPGSELAD